MVTSPTSYTERDVNVRGLKLHFQEWGESDAPLILMLHGFGVSGHMFDEFADRARDSYHLIAVDQRGHGDSDWSESGDYSRDAFVEDIESFRKELGLDSFILMGHSMGGLNAAAYTSRYPEHVKALVLVDVGPEAAKEGVDNIVRFTRGPDDLEFEQFVEMAHRFNPRRSIENIRERMRHRLRPTGDGKWTWKFDKRFRQEGNSLRVGSEASNDEMWGMFSSLTGPTLIIRGAESDVLTPEVAERAARDMQNATLVTVPRAGHSVPGDNPDDFTAEVRGFLARLDDAGATGPGAVEDGPTLDELVESNESARRRRPGSITILALALAAIAALAGATFVVTRGRKKGKASRAEAARLDAELEASQSRNRIDIDLARQRSAQLAGDLNRLARVGGRKARNAAHQIEIAEARESAVDIARMLGERGMAAEHKLVAAVPSRQSIAAHVPDPRTLRPRRKKRKTAMKVASGAGRMLITMAVARGVRKGRKQSRRSIPGWRR